MIERNSGVPAIPPEWEEFIPEDREACEGILDVNRGNMKWGALRTAAARLISRYRRESMSDADSSAAENAIIKT